MEHKEIASLSCLLFLQACFCPPNKLFAYLISKSSIVTFSEKFWRFHEKLYQYKCVDKAKHCSAENKKVQSWWRGTLLRVSAITGTLFLSNAHAFFDGL